MTQWCHLLQSTFLASKSVSKLYSFYLGTSLRPGDKDVQLLQNKILFGHHNLELVTGEKDLRCSIRDRGKWTQWKEEMALTLPFTLGHWRSAKHTWRGSLGPCSPHAPFSTSFTLRYSHLWTWALWQITPQWTDDQELHKTLSVWGPCVGQMLRGH